MKSDVLDNPGKAAERRITERRLTERVKNKWARIARGRLPSLREVEELNLGPDRPFCFAIDLRLSDIFPYFVYMGEEISRFSSAYPLGDPRREKTLLDAAMTKMDQAALNREPVEYSDIKKLDDGRRVAFRSILLPVSENGQDVSHIFGAAKGRML
ncbi:hypothetical protein [Hyphococcus luteus]|uniref:PAS domain-containing protein n=1 Tax=Hyphococcus luteus TaxID=2058213 RepID=A0A2S7K0X2_9PROT|nr:hypothetical protein [Marinicaulis flavus]PQA86149.1 hypothetical protein CW354_17470 [Marinicaulis flavus]